jgi:integrase
MDANGSVYKRCGCRQEGSNRKLGPGCPKLSKPGHGSWYIALDVPSACGGRERIRRGGYPTRASARQALIELRGTERPGAGIVTVETWLNRWLDNSVRLRESTRCSYTQLCRNHLIPYLGRVPLRDLTGQQISGMLESVRRFSAASKRPVSDGTIARIFATLRAALNAAVRQGLIEHNPARLVEQARARRPHAVVWTEARINQYLLDGQRPPVAVWTATQTAHFLHTIREHRLYAAYHLIALRGLRRGEAAGLRWCDVDLDGQVLTIRQQIQRVGGHLAQCPTKTESSCRTIALDRTTTAVLRRHHARQQAEAATYGTTPSGYVFTNQRGAPLNPDRLTRLLYELTAAAGLPPVRLHDLRHGAASLALQAGADLKVVQDQLGHSSVVITADTYVSVLPDVARQAAEDTATLILQTGRLIPGTNRPRRPQRTTKPRKTRPRGTTGTPPRRGRTAATA